MSTVLRITLASSTHLTSLALYAHTQSIDALTVETEFVWTTCLIRAIQRVTSPVNSTYLTIRAVDVSAAL